MEMRGINSQRDISSFFLKTFKISLVVIIVMILILTTFFVPMDIFKKRKKSRLLEYEEGDSGKEYELGLAVKILTDPKLRKYFTGPAHLIMGEYEIIYRRGEFKFKWSDDEIEVFLRNELVKKFKFTGKRGEVVSVSFNVNGCSVKMVLCLCEKLREIRTPQYLRDETLRLLKQSPFIKWLKEEGFNHTIKKVDYVGLSPWIVNCSVTSAIVRLEVDGLKVYHHVYFERQYIVTLNTSLPREVMITQSELEKYDAIFLFFGRRTQVEANYLASKESLRHTPSSERVNVTKELIEIIFKELKKSRILSRLLTATNCKVKVRRVIPSGAPSNEVRSVEVLLESEEFKEYALIVYIHLKSNVPMSVEIVHHE